MRSHEPVRLDVIVPVFNGEAELPQTLSSLASQAGSAHRVTVVLNGCRDRSREVALAGLEQVEAAGAMVRLLESDAPSRAAALNAGEAGSGSHRLYLDQDAILSPGSLTRIVRELDAGAHFVGARAVWRTPSRAVAEAMRAWSSLPYVIEQPVTAGMYAVSAIGRRRWGAWPATMPDDKFARLHFAPGERRVAPGVTYRVSAPSNFRDLAVARQRYRASNLAIQRHAPELMVREGRRTAGVAALAARSPDLWPGMAVLGAAELSAWLRAR